MVLHTNRGIFPLSYVKRKLRLLYLPRLVSLNNENKFRNSNVFQSEKII